MTIVQKITFLFAIFIISSERVFSCSPYGYPAPPLNYLVAKTQRIYIGTVISKSSTINRRDNYKYRLIRIKFKVEKALKGVDNEIQEIMLEEPLKKHRNSCYRKPPDFKKGEQWIIEDSSSQSTEVQYYLNGYIGSYGNYLKYSFERDRRLLDSLETAIKNSFTAIYGEVQTFWAGSYISDAEVVAKGAGLELSTKTGKYGEYSFENIPAGNYKIQIRLPYKSENFYGRRQPVFDEQTKTYYLEYEVSIKPNDSEYYFAVVGDRN